MDQAQKWDLLMARFDDIEARLSVFDSRLVTLDDRTAELPGDLENIRNEINDLDRGLGRINCDCDAESAFVLLDDIAYEMQSRERQEMLAGAREGIRRLEAKKGKAS